MFSCAFTLQCFASDLSVWGGSPHEFSTQITCFHDSLPDVEQENSDDPLKKIRTVYNRIKRKCRDLYQPLRELSIDERMVKSKARTSFCQYIRNKPSKWGFKFWVLARPMRVYFRLRLVLWQEENCTTFRTRPVV